MRKGLIKLKNGLYFLVAAYFKFWARVQLKKWHPRVIVVTGSSGKTTLLHLVQSQLGNRARYSHHANSAFGIPFNILGLGGVAGNRFKWLSLLILAPIKAFKRPWPQKLYVAEADAERPGEAPFLAGLLKPEVTIWVSSSRTHAAYYDRAVKRGRFASIEAAVAHEYGSLVASTTGLVIADGDNPLITKQLERSQAECKLATMDDVKAYTLDKTGTRFQTSSGNFTLAQLLPRPTGKALVMLTELLKYLGVKGDPKFSNFSLPPGRSSIFAGQKGVTIIDSSYNANLDSMEVVLDMLRAFKAGHKWLVLSDMVEEGRAESAQHRRLAELVSRSAAERVVLVGRRLKRHAWSYLQQNLPKSTELVVFESPQPALEYLRHNLTGRETVLFKGALLLEGVIERLLANASDAKYLCRREPVWAKRRAKWGL